MGIRMTALQSMDEIAAGIAKVCAGQRDYTRGATAPF